MSCMDETAARRLRAAEEILAADRACAGQKIKQRPAVKAIGVDTVVVEVRNVACEQPRWLILSHDGARDLAAGLIAALTT